MEGSGARGGGRNWCGARKKKIRKPLRSSSGGTKRVFAVAGGVLRNREDVEDIAQQVFLKAYFSIKRFDRGRRSAPGCIR